MPDTTTSLYATTPAPAASRPALSSLHIRHSKGQRRLAMLTAYDAPTAALVDSAGIDMVLVGDSLGMAVLGRKDTLSVSMDEMVHHCRAVTSAVSHALVVGDMPFMSYECGPENALHNAGRLMAQGGVRAVKLEGGTTVLPQVRALVAAGIPVMGHLGLTPQRFAVLGGFKVQGKSADSAQFLCAEALALQEAGCFALVLECVPQEVAKHITSLVAIPTIGIGAGAGCDGQVLVFHDMLGLTAGHTPRFVKRYADLATIIHQAVGEYVRDVREGTFPTTEHMFTMPEDESTSFHAACHRKTVV
ncbi:MAG: 3-methyl-2-oxobutanoate hydroxymethyltransferase [Desulfovibrionaceae bacterium]